MLSLSLLFVFDLFLSGIILSKKKKQTKQNQNKTKPIHLNYLYHFYLFTDYFKWYSRVCFDYLHSVIDCNRHIYSIYLFIPFPLLWLYSNTHYYCLKNIPWVIIVDTNNNHKLGMVWGRLYVDEQQKCVWHQFPPNSTF
jgi:hypothetical protein